MISIFSIQNGTRRAWAESKCEMLRSGPKFAECRRKLSGEENDFYRECIFDACGCDKGGDCECLCTAIANMAARCNQVGVPVEWRDNHLCGKFLDNVFFYTTMKQKLHDSIMLLILN